MCKPPIKPAKAPVTIKQKINIQENMNQVIGRFIDNFFNECEATIKESGQKLTHFCLI